MRRRSCRKCYELSAALIAFGIKHSIDNSSHGDVVFDIKADESARHYAEGFGVKQIPNIGGSPKRFLLADEDICKLFSNYLSEAI